MRARVGLLALAVLGVLMALALSRSPTPARGPVEPWSVRRPAEIDLDIDRTERASRALGDELQRGLLYAVRERQWDALRGTLAPDFSARFAAFDGLRPVQTGSVALFEVPTDGPVLDAEGLTKALSGFVHDLSVVERTSWRPYATVIARDGASAYSLAHAGFAGRRVDGTRVEWSGSIEVEATLEPPRLRRLGVVAGTWTEVAGAGFEDVSEAAGFGFVDSDLDRETAQGLIDLRRLFSSGGITIVDLNHDGHPDVLASRKGRGARLFLNDGAGGFDRRALGVPDEQAAHLYLAVDLDEDGVEELVGTEVVARRRDEAELGLYRWRDGRAVRVPGALPFVAPAWLREMDYESLVVCDVDGDRDLDLLGLGYMHGGSGGEGFNVVDGRDGLPNLLFINEGGLRFSEQGRARGLLETRYSYVAECHDFDEDGDVDLLVGNDYGNNDYYVNDGGGRFARVEGHAFTRARGFTMGFSMADFDNSGRWAVSLSNMYSHAGNRIVPLAASLSEAMREQVLALAAGNNLFERDGAEWRDIGPAMRVDLADWAWGNVFFDFDNDRDKDQFVVNGFTTHRDARAPDY